MNRRSFLARLLGAATIAAATRLPLGVSAAPEVVEAEPQQEFWCGIDLSKDSDSFTVRDRHYTGREAPQAYVQMKLASGVDPDNFPWGPPYRPL